MNSCLVKMPPCSPALPSIAALAVSILSLCSSASSAGPLGAPHSVVSGKVIHVNDGDTVVLLSTAREKMTIRLSDIDAPELGHGNGRPGQAYSAQASLYLKSIALGRTGSAECFDVERRAWGNSQVKERLICKLTVDGIDVNTAMLAAGLAMAYRPNPAYVRNALSFQVEAKAKKEGRGLWAVANPVPPWQWRKDCWSGGKCATAEGR